MRSCKHIFTSRCDDGSYTRRYFSYVDENGRGRQNLINCVSLWLREDTFL